MKFSIIINTHNQEKFIDRCIQSCLAQETNEKFEIILVDTSDKTTVDKKKYSNINIITAKEFSNFPCINQLQSIKKGFEVSKGEIICMLDGDDFFSKNKLNYINNTFKNKSFLNQDIYVKYFYFNNTKAKLKIKKYKNNYFYKKLFNDWPEVYSTSSISVSRDLLNSFYSEIDYKNWPFLAIDAKLVLYAKKFDKVFFSGEKLTYKMIHNTNLDNTYSSLCSKNFWSRRYQQHDYYKYIYKKNYIFNIDFIISKLLSS